MSKDYAVEVLGKYSHGCYGKTKYQVWCLSADSKKKACDFAYEIVAGMTWREIYSELYEGKEEFMRLPFDVEYKNHQTLDDMIGYESAETYFSYRAEIMKEVEK